MMSVLRSPPSLSTSLYETDPSLNRTKNDEVKVEMNYAKREKREFNDSPVNSNSSIDEIKAMIGEFKAQEEIKLDSLPSSINTLVEQNIDIRKSIEFVSH